MKPGEQQEPYWDEVAEEKTFTTDFQIDAFKKQVAFEKKVLDVGCGYGRTLNELQREGYQDLSGVDFSQGMINRGLKINPLLNLIKNSNGILPFEDASFDAVILVAVLTCIALDQDQTRLISEIQRVLKENGILYVNDFLLNTDNRNIERYNQYKEKYEKYGVFELAEGALVRHHTKKDILEKLKEFNTITFEPIVYTTMNGNKSNGFYYLGKKKV
ncbi:class I SAM-dependent methyltransferase [bacterium]|nr:class I SAM-dependent methyltransferase [bacterium]